MLGCNNCYVMGRSMYHYTESGLNNVWLLNGYITHNTPYGKGVAIEHADDLHRVIALSLVNHKPRLSGGEFRFIRKELDMSQAALAHILGNDSQSIARWEKKGRVPRMAERFLRALYREHAQGNAGIRELVERLNQMAQKVEKRLVLEETPKGWEARAA
jgi:DNA-binding transcriptional regulator YiaG